MGMTCWEINVALLWPDEHVSEQVLINAPCLSNYLAPSSRCWADVSDEVSTALLPLLCGVAARRFPWTGQVMGWECRTRSLEHGWKDNAINEFSQLCCLIQGLFKKTVGLGREV